ncbi:hypothetical protein [Bacillus sp. FJAT-52991]|uniref:HTH cro/C1-type domain-containing protein n=1 Tax=Bacillus kandeliae TaxID=3129297 RepID=A0ABZ2NB99_9BACI
MAEYINPDKLALSEDFFKLAVLDEVRQYLLNRRVIEEWQQYVTEEINQVSSGEKKYKSFDWLCEIVRSLLVNQKISQENIRKVFKEHHEYILERMHEHISQDFPIDVHRSMNEAAVQLAKEERQLVSSMDHQFHLVRNIVTQPKIFVSAGETNELFQAEIKDSRGNVHGIARVNLTGGLDLPFTDEEQEYWDKLRTAFSAMDEMTADIFDIICFLFLFAPKDEDGYLYFHSNDALKLRSNVVDPNDSLEVRERDRFNIMSRVKALSNIWISLKEGEVIEVDESDLNESKKYKYRDFQKMFEVGKVRAAYDKNDKFLGIYACQIKPTSLLTSFLNENKRLGIIDLSALEFHPVRQRPEKRLSRYLATQWFIRMSKNNLTQPFSVKTLLREIDFSARTRGMDMYDRFIKALDELKKKGIVKDWSFTEPVDFRLFGRTGWLSYFRELKVSIIPSAEMIEKNKRKLSILEDQHQVNSSAIHHMIESFSRPVIVQDDRQPEAEPVKEEQPSPPPAVKKDKEASASSAVTEDTLTPEMVINERKRRSLSIAKASKEIGIGYNTLKRFENQETKRRNKKNDLKIAQWLKQSQLKNAEG